MSLASRISNFLSPNTSVGSGPADDIRGSIAFGDGGQESHVRYIEAGSKKRARGGNGYTEREDTEAQSPYLHCMLAGGVGGTTGDLLMHSVDTVKTRQQGDSRIPAKYASMSSSYITIFREEGVRRGLYGGVTPAFLGSFPGTIIFFGTYEYSKRHLLDMGVHAPIAYLTGGFLADLAASVIYVPSEVLKTRLQLQGRYNNPFFNSGYNYRSTADAARTIIRNEGFSALFYGYRATLMRDLPFSAFQFAFYEQGQTWAKQWCGGQNIGLPLELLTAAAAGGLAGVITCPLDVVKTRIQTQVNPTANTPPQKGSTLVLQPQGSRPTANPKRGLHHQSSSTLPTQTRHISTSSPSTSTCKPGSTTLDTSSIITGLRLLYKAEGLTGLFRGVGPRFVWTSVQSGTMLVLYQYLLRQLNKALSTRSSRAEGHPLT
ncbi:hypothetical protein GP486_002293 [Trichoglossum hirsutum]|uniref:Mitochondrial carrier protein n=1 Tax=Trichoglossum hirsutum TaxID=265104 RepID=A0A9P8RS80_9PEZI|nr:hypothetical protein GP486_002293 [Trichoglossum hirsutum]